MSKQVVVALSKVTKRFSGHTAVHDLDLVIPKGAVYGLLGRNGAGKTTTIRMIMNILLPDAGSVELFGQRYSGRQVAHRIGYLPEERGLYKKMKVLELLVYLAQIKGVAARTARASAASWLDLLDLGEWRDRKVDDLSKGMQQKVQFVSTVLHEPELVILDEPFAGLDPVNTQVIKDVVLELARSGATVLFSTHIMEQAEKLCDSVCIIGNGEKVVDGPLGELKRKHEGQHVVVAVERKVEGITRLFEDRSFVSKTDDYGQYAELQLADSADPQSLLVELIKIGARVTRFEIAEPTLNKIFIDLVGPEASNAAVSEGSAGA